MGTYEKKGYKSSVPLGTLMLTERHIEMRKTWAQVHMNDNWDRTIFTDETAFDLFRNKICRWHKNGERPIRRLPKTRQKVMAWVAFLKAEKHPCFALQILWMGYFM